MSCCKGGEPDGAYPANGGGYTDNGEKTHAKDCKCSQSRLRRLEVLSYFFAWSMTASSCEPACLRRAGPHDCQDWQRRGRLAGTVPMARAHVFPFHVFSVLRSCRIPFSEFRSAQVQLEKHLRERNERVHSALTDLHTHLEAYSSPSHNRDNPLDTCLAAACLSGGGPAM